jgi:N-acetylneuraminate synthase
MFPQEPVHSRCLIVGEVAQSHDGSLGLAHAFVDAVANAGADAVKFQTHIAAAESTPGEPWRVQFSRQDESRYDYWRRMEFSEEQWRGLQQHAADAGLKFLSSPFSVEAVELLQRVGVHAWKIASGEVGNLPMLERIAASGQPVFVSSGMSPLEELDQAVRYFQGHGNPVTVLQCTSSYPSPPDKIGLNMIPFFRQRYGCDVGLSDHSGTIYPGLAAAVVGIEVLEAHVTLDRRMFGPDVKASVTTAEFKQLVDGIRFMEQMRANPVDKDRLASELEPLRQMFTKSVVARGPLKAGTVLTSDHLALKKPGTGIPADRLSEVLGRRLKADLPADALLREEDLE